MRSTQDPHSQSGLKITSSTFYKKCRQVGSTKNVVKIVSVLAINPAILSLFLFPLTASACGIFDIKSCFSGGSKAEAEEIVSSNSQNIALLQATLSPNQNSSSTTGELSIVDDVYISSETQAIADSKTIDDEQISVYVVRQGDTLPIIAKMFGVSVNTIKWGNDLKSDKLTLGQTLVILPISGVQHVVKSGDTLQAIAKLHKGDLDEIMQYNNLTKNSKLVVGDVIVVPDGEAAPVSAGTRRTSAGTSGGPTYSGYYMRPIVGGIKTQGIHGHNGVDLASSYGANVLASASGEVIIARVGWNGGYGTYVVIKHGNGTQTLYGHLSSLAVSPGDRVNQGQIIGKMGSTGKSTGVHVHFEIRGARNPF
ncbi:MAG: peptidase M23 family protein [Parcubacteria group bacterium Gr01-1014_46]|nr:MAG: peptidase M23 family protein [Parcubacteria group bacterium Gr01-1014_46]